MMNRGQTLSFHRIPVSYWKSLLAIGLLLFLVGCGGDSQSAPPQQVSLTVSPDAQSLWVHGTQQFTATVTGSSNTAVTWSVSETNGGTVNASGAYTAPATAGTYHVIATSQADTTKSASAAVIVTVPAPTFASTPVTDAAQDTPYAYAIDASDPAGTAVTLALISGPEGATLDGNTVSWTPSWQQSRQNNAFLVRATSAAGGTADQAWSLAPTGTILGSAVHMRFSTDGTVQFQVNSMTESDNYHWAALVPQSDNSLLVLPGTGYRNASWDVAGVPAGYYWMQLNPGEVVWTNQSMLDWGSNWHGRLQGPMVRQYFNCNLTGLDPWEMGKHTIQFFSFNAQAFAAILDKPWFGIPAPGDTTCIANDSQMVWGIPEIRGDIASAVQFEHNRNTVSFFRGEIAGPALHQPVEVVVPNGTTTIAGELTRQLPKSQNFTVAFSAWKDAFDKAGPSTAIPRAVEIYLESYLRVDVGVPNPMLNGFMPILAGALADDSSAWPKDADGNNVWPQDGDFGTLDYNDAFATWADTVYHTSLISEYKIPFPNSDVPVSLLTQWISRSTEPGENFAPLLQPVGNPQVNGTSLFTQTTVPTVTPTLTWEPPASDEPSSVNYWITICEPTWNGTSAKCENFYSFALYPMTSFTMPAGILQPGHSYIFGIQSEFRRSYNPLHPWRYGLPELSAWVVSAAITVDAAAPAGIVHGDQSLLIAKQGQVAARQAQRAGFNVDPASLSQRDNFVNAVRPQWLAPEEQQPGASPQTAVPKN